MSKVIFWLVVIFAILFVLRLINTSKARRRNQASNSPKSRNAAENNVMVRCVRCGVFLPRVDALPSPHGFTCGDAACVGKNR